MAEGAHGRGKGQPGHQRCKMCLPNRFSDGSKAKRGNMGGNPKGRRRLTGLFHLTLRQEVALTIFLAGAPLAALIAFWESGVSFSTRLLVLSLGAVFAAVVALALAVQFLGFLRSVEEAARRWGSGDLQYRLAPARMWSGEFRRLAEVLNDMAGRRKRFYEREREIALTLQRMLVSPLPRAWESFAFADYYRAGSDVADVGGDFYALFPLTDGRLGLLFGDIGGRGLDAAAQIASLRYAMEAYAREGLDPQEMMAYANGSVCEAEDQIVTLVYLLLDPRDGTVEFVNAGHEPVLFRRCESGTWEPVVGGGPALGVIPSVTFPTTRLLLCPNDLLLLYTDGVASVGPKEGDWSTDDLLGQVGRITGDTPSDVVRGLSTILPSGVDDAALVAVKWVPLPPAPPQGER